jgi:dipeptide/tripeptide permease
MVFVFIEMWERFLLYGMGPRHFMADKVFGLALS